MIRIEAGTFHLVHHMQSFDFGRSFQLAISDKFNSKHQSSSPYISNNYTFTYTSISNQLAIANKEIHPLGKY